MWENVFSRGILRIQPKALKYFPKHFLGCNQTPEKIFLIENILHLKIFYILPNTALISFFFLRKLKTCGVENKLLKGWWKLGGRGISSSIVDYWSYILAFV